MALDIGNFCFTHLFFFAWRGAFRSAFENATTIMSYMLHSTNRDYACHGTTKEKNRL